MAQELVSALFDRWNGKPILVIGGGPSVLTDLPLVGIEPACVISANDHGSKQSHYPVDIYTNVDKRHCLLKVPMEGILRPLGGLIVNKHSWADYRLADWSFGGNTGLCAIVLAAALGGNPVLVTGIDFWDGGRRYFHDSNLKPLKPTSKEKQLANIERRNLRMLVGATTGANIRPLSGPLKTVYPLYCPTEVLPPTRATPYRGMLARQSTVYLEVVREFSLSNSDRAKLGTRLALSRKEAERVQRSGFAK